MVQHRAGPLHHPEQQRAAAALAQPHPQQQARLQPQLPGRQAIPDLIGGVGQMTPSATPFAMTMPRSAPSVSCIAQRARKPAMVVRLDAVMELMVLQMAFSMASSLEGQKANLYSQIE